MKQKGQFSEWIIFYENDANALRAHFEAGGTVEMLDGDNVNGDLLFDALYNCCNQNAEKCLPLMMSHGAVPNYKTWVLVLSLTRYDCVKSFLAYGFLPTFVEIDIAKRSSASFCRHLRNLDVEFNCAHLITQDLCRRSTLSLLYIMKMTVQPLSSMWFLIARKVWITRHYLIWFNCLAEG